MKFTQTKLLDSYIIEPNIFQDTRGFFFRTYCKDEYAKIGHNEEWVQMNHSFTSQKGTIRGMHFQSTPFKEIKLVRCIAGSVYDVIVDIRESSPTFLQWVAVELSAENCKMIYIPAGFAHGFQTLSDKTELIYLHSNFYKPQAEMGINFNDPLIDIKWPLALTEISEKDKNYNYLNKNFKGI